MLMQFIYGLSIVEKLLTSNTVIGNDESVTSGVRRDIKQIGW